MFNKAKARSAKRIMKENFTRSFVHVRPDPDTLPPTSRPYIEDIHLYFRQDAEKQDQDRVYKE